MHLRLVAGLNACSFCYGAQRAVAKAFDADLLETIMETGNYDLVEEKMRPILHLTKKLTLEPGKVYDGDINAITAAG